MYYFIVNIKSRSGKAETLWNKIKLELENKNIDYKYFISEYPGHEKLIAEELTEKIKEPFILVAVGGDGTINKVINGIKNFEYVSFATIQTGSGNDFSRGLNRKDDSIKILNDILSKKSVKKLDICKLESLNRDYSKKFVISSGIGFDASICLHSNDSSFKTILNKSFLRKLIYIFSAIIMFTKYKPIDIKVEDSKGKVSEYKKVYFCTVMNLPYEGGGAMLCPDANGFDDLVNLCIIYQDKIFPPIITMLKSIKGHHKNSKNSVLLKDKYFIIETKNKTWVHTDGEKAKYFSRLKFSVNREKLKFIA